MMHASLGFWLIMEALDGRELTDGRMCDGKRGGPTSYGSHVTSNMSMWKLGQHTLNPERRLTKVLQI